MYRAVLLSCLCASICAIRRNGERKAVVFQGKGFKIQSSSYHEQCLVYRNPWTSSRLFDPSLTLKNCDQNSTAYARHWLWTKDEELKLKDGQGCLTASPRGVLFLRRCGFEQNYAFQKFECSRNLLKLKNINAYLVPFNFSTGNISLFGVLMRTVATKQRIGATVYGGGEWTQYGRGASLCENMSV